MGFDWERHRSLIERLIQDQNHTLKEIAAEVRKQDPSFTASLSAYNQRLSKWGLQKFPHNRRTRNDRLAPSSTKPSSFTRPSPRYSKTRRPSGVDEGQPLNRMGNTGVAGSTSHLSPPDPAALPLVVTPPAHARRFDGSNIQSSHSYPHSHPIPNCYSRLNEHTPGTQLSKPYSPPRHASVAVGAKYTAATHSNWHTHQSSSPVSYPLDDPVFAQDKWRTYGNWRSPAATDMSRSSTSIVSSPTSESLYSFYSTPLSATSIAISKPDHFQSTQEISKLVEADEAMSQFVERSWSNPRAEDETGKTPLVCLILMVRPLFGSHSECPPNRIDLIKLCLSTGVDVNAYDKAGFTALHHLLLKPLLKSEDEAKCVLHLLLEAGADVHLRDPTGGTALHLACQSGLPECTALLIQHITKNPYYYHHHALGVNATNDKGRSVVAEAQRSLAFAQSATESDRIQQCVDQVIEAGGR